MTSGYKVSEVRKLSSGCGKTGGGKSGPAQSLGPEGPPHLGARRIWTSAAGSTTLMHAAGLERARGSSASCRRGAPVMPSPPSVATIASTYSLTHSLRKRLCLLTVSLSGHRGCHWGGEGPGPHFNRACSVGEEIEVRHVIAQLRI